MWERVDLPVLSVLASSSHEQLRHGFLSIESYGSEAIPLELEPGALHDSTLRLGDAGYVEFADLAYEGGGGASFTGFRVTGRGQQAIGEWPLFDSVASPLTLALLLERLAEYVPTDEEATNLRRAATYVRSLGAGTLKAAAITATSQLARLALGLG